MDNIVKLRDIKNDSSLPVTHEIAVRDSNGTTLETKLQIIDDKLGSGNYDISAHNSGATYANLSEALGTNGANIPTAYRKGGMSVKFIQSSDHKYVQYRYMGTVTTGTTFTSVTSWQGVDDIPTAGSDNLVKSGGVKNQLTNISDSLSSVKDIYFDVTPEGRAYWSAGGVLTPLNSYRYKSINVSNIAGKYILVKAGYNPIYYTEYCYIKKSDETYLPLGNYAIKNLIAPSNCSLIKLPEDAVQLDISWDYTNGVRAIVSYNYLINEVLNKQSSLESSLDEILFDQSIQLIDASNPDYTKKYWDANGELQTLNSYRAFEVNISSYIGKNIKVRAGYQISASAGIVGYCWIKKYDNSVVALSNYIQEFISGECAVVQIPEDAEKLLLSWDRTTYNSNGWSDAYCIYEIKSEFSKLQDNVEILNNQVESLTVKSSYLDGKKIFLFGDSISSTDYTWYKNYLALYTGATVYNQGASGRDVAYQASNEYFQRLANLPSDVVVVLVGGNDSGVSGSIGTFDSNSPLGQMGESVVQETDISIDYNGTTFIQAISHIIRKWRSLYWNFRLAAGLNANILDTQNDNEVVYPLSGTATESQCISYAQSQGWTLGYGERYVMKTTETNADKRVKLIAVKQPKLFLCTTLPQRRYNSLSDWSNPQNWERKRLACIECAEKYGIPLIDLAKEFAIDWNAEPYWPGQGYSGTSKTDNQGIYTMDGLHPNEFGYAYISRIVSKYLISDISI